MLRASRIVLVVMACAAVLACDAPKPPLREWQPSHHAQPATPDPSRTAASEPGPREPEAGGVERAAAALWGVSCASCHGRDGRGLGPARPPGAQLPDFSTAEFQKSRSDAQLADVIVNGRSLMPAFGKQLNPQGIEALIAHIRRLGQPAPSAP
jgi:mono/diheme cytochrome c family protein